MKMYLILERDYDVCDHIAVGTDEVEAKRLVDELNSTSGSVYDVEEWDIDDLSKLDVVDTHMASMLVNTTDDTRLPVVHQPFARNHRRVLIDRDKPEVLEESVIWGFGPRNGPVSHVSIAVTARTSAAAFARLNELLEQAKVSDEWSLRFAKEA